MSAWPMPDMQKQVDSIREAFSADLRKPFTLKPNFLHGSPASSHASPPRPSYSSNMPRTQSLEGQLDTSANQQSYMGHPISPPTSAGPVDSKGDVLSMVMMAPNQGSQASMMQQSHHMPEAPSWNPSRIIE